MKTTDRIKISELQRSRISWSFFPYFKAYTAMFPTPWRFSVGGNQNKPCSHYGKDKLITRTKLQSRIKTSCKETERKRRRESALKKQERIKHQLWSSPDYSLPLQFVNNFVMKSRIAIKTERWRPKTSSLGELSDIYRYSTTPEEEKCKAMRQTSGVNLQTSKRRTLLEELVRFHITKPTEPKY